MKKCILLFFVLLMALGLVAFYLAMKPTITPDSMTDLSAPEKMSIALQDKGEQSGIFDVQYEWDLSHSPNNTLLLGEDSAALFPLLHPSIWHIHARIQDGKFVFTSKPPTVRAKDPSCSVRSQFLAEFGMPFKQMHPDGTVHTKRTLSLVCEIWLYRPFFQKPLHAFAIQEIKVDLIDGSADLIRPLFALMSAPGVKHTFVSNGPEARLPSLYCGSQTEQLLTRALHTLAAINSKEVSRSYTSQLLKTAQELMKLQSNPQAPWPDCWGEDAPVARRISRRVVPTLLRLQEHECYQNEELIQFINSDTFSHIFGDKFDASPEPLQDMEPIHFEKK